MTESAESSIAVSGRQRWADRSPRLAGVLYLAGLVLYILPTALHGNPPVEDGARAVLDYVGNRSSLLWRIAHLANIAGVVLWMVALALQVPLSRPVGRAALAVWGVAAAVFGVYFGLHSMALPVAADQMVEAGADVAAVVERAEAVLLVLGAVAFVGQGLLGAAIAALGLFLLRATGVNRYFAWAGVIIGTGWTVGALALEFGIIVPCTVLAWVWIAVLGVWLIRRRG